MKSRKTAIKWSMGFVCVMLFLAHSSFARGDDQVVTKYADDINWLSKPSPEKAVDIFYVYPTVWSKDICYGLNSCPIDYPMMRRGAVFAYNRQATAFETVGNIFAPFYRQLDADYTLGLPEESRWEAIKNTPAKDVIEAFDYYITHLNTDRPFILAGHSQGSSVLLVLLADYMQQHPDVYERMIAAYVIGYPVTKEFLAKNSHLKFATGADDTGVIISYNTQSPKVLPGANPVVAKNVGLVINPISWTTTETVAPISEGLGSFMPDPKTRIFSKAPQCADAKIDKKQGVLICNTVDELVMFQLSSAMGLGVYHSCDYSFYYFNIRQNAENRANKFLSK